MVSSGGEVAGGRRMQRIPAVGLAVGLAAIVCASAATQTDPGHEPEHDPGHAPSHDEVASITYRFAPVMVEGRNALHVVETFRARQAETEIVIPEHWGGAAHLENQTQNLKLDTPGATLTDDPKDAGGKLLHARPGERIELSYDIVSQQKAWFRHPQEHMAVINADYFLFNPQNALVYPEMPGTGDVDATFDWRALPKGLPILTSFGIDERVTHVRAPWIRIADAVFAGGNFRVSKSEQNGTTLVFAARGIWSFSDADALAQIRRIIDAENQFWGAAPLRYFLVTLAPFDDRVGDEDGSAFTNAYMLFLSHEDPMDSEQLRLMAHEMFHQWNPKSMGPRDADETAQWFAEGFTVYYAGVIPLRAGLTPYGDYLEYLNRWLRRYELSPLRGMKEADWKAMPHSSGEGYELSYERGAAMALWADTAIRARSGGKASLDNVMFDLVKQSQTQSPPPDFTEERVLAAFAPYLSADEMSQLHAMAVDGADVPLPSTLGSCAQLEHKPTPIVDPGFDVKATMANKVVSGVVADGAAWRAGIRDGQPMFRISIYNDDPSKDALLGVVVSGEKKMITFSPTRPVSLGQYAASGEGAKACTPF
jgi:predicted metalloprotease with PDZ domain